MGTKLQRAIDLLATKSFVIESEIRDSMERASEQSSIEAVKKTMLKQEETFKQQVMELHRLYSVQRMLMEELKKEMNEQRKHLRRTTAAGSGQGTIQNDRDEHTWQLSGSGSSDPKTGAHAEGNVGFDFGIIRPADQGDSAGLSMRSMDAAAGPSSSCIVIRAGSARIGEEDLCGVDLTLSIGGSRKRPKESQPQQSVGLESSEATKSDQKSSAGTTTVEQGDEKRPPWSLL